MNEESLGETVLKILVAMLLSIVLALILMGAMGVHFLPPGRDHHRPRAPVTQAEHPKPHPNHDDSV